MILFLYLNLWSIWYISWIWNKVQIYFFPRWLVFLTLLIEKSFLSIQVLNATFIHTPSLKNFWDWTFILVTNLSMSKLVSGCLYYCIFTLFNILYRIDVMYKCNILLFFEKLSCLFLVFIFQVEFLNSIRIFIFPRNRIQVLFYVFSSLIHLEVFIEYFLWANNPSRYWGYNREQTEFLALRELIF